MMLYQYWRNIQKELDVGNLQKHITEGELKFSMPSGFNDPFDCCPTHWSELPEESGLPHEIGETMNKFVQTAISANHGIACFTSHPDKFLMWSHYGDQHRGVCIGFDSQTLLETPPVNSEGNPLYSSIEKVKYTSNRPSDDDPEFYIKKSEEWVKEEEYRIISSRKKGDPMWGPGKWKIPKESIKEIILGALVSPKAEQKIVNLVKNKTPHIAIKKVVLHMQKYELLIENFEDRVIANPMSGSLLNPNGKWEEI